MIGLITGANKGLGFQLVKRGLELGNTMIAGVYKADQQLDLVQLKPQYRERLMILELDVTKDKDIKSIAELIDEKYGRLDLVVNNAGILLESKYDSSDPIGDLNIEQLRLNLEVNTIGPARVLKYLIPLMYKSESATIINISSEAGHLSGQGHVYMMYSISKHALNMYTQKISNYLKEHRKDKNMKVVMVHPGRMNTDMGVENAQIEPVESAQGVWDIITGKISSDYEIPFINYLGQQMPY